MTTENDNSQSMSTYLECPSCGEKGNRVKDITLQTLLKPEAQSRITEGSYRFCGNENCEIVYFSEDMASAFSKDEL